MALYWHSCRDGAAGTELLGQHCRNRLVGYHIHPCVRRTFFVPQLNIKSIPGNQGDSWGCVLCLGATYTRVNSAALWGSHSLRIPPPPPHTHTPQHPYRDAVWNGAGFVNRRHAFAITLRTPRAERLLVIERLGRVHPADESCATSLHKPLGAVPNTRQGRWAIMGASRTISLCTSMGDLVQTMQRQLHALRLCSCQQVLSPHWACVLSLCKSTICVDVHWQYENRHETGRAMRCSELAVPTDLTRDTTRDASSVNPASRSAQRNLSLS